jgi:hypothetical protein
MSSAFFELYRSTVFELAKTMVIKFDPAAQTINRELAMLGHDIDLHDKTTWKYYMNLSGMYHYTDTVMQIESLDQPGVMIDFTLQNLEANRLTKLEYRYGSRFYKRLVNAYPTQEFLILGILHPVDITAAIEAEDGDILYYNPTLIEDNESNLIPELQSWVKNFIARWYIDDYSKVDTLFQGAMLGVLFVNIPQRIMNIRLSNAKTERAHSYHIREYLESNGRLAKYIRFLTKKQMLFLYRNIRYIHRNAGQRRIFLLLVEKILSERALPLAGYNLEHALENILTNLVPEVIVRREAINFIQTGTGSDTRTVSYLVNKEAEETPISAFEESVAVTQTSEKMIKHFGDDLTTKVLESSVLDLTDSVVFPLANVLLNHWIYYAATNQYTSVVAITNPSTGERLFVNVKDAAILYIYCMRKGFLKDDANEIPDEIPEWPCRILRQDPAPTAADLLNVVDSDYVKPEVIQAALAIEYETPVMGTPEAFYEACQAIQTGLMAHRDLYVRQEHLYTRGLVERMVGSFYFNTLVELTDTPTTYTDWLIDKGIDFDTMTPEDYRVLSVELVRQATGAGINTSKQLREMHRAMIELMQQLSSYSVQYIRSINSASTLIIDNITQRVGDTLESFADNAVVKIPIAVASKTRFHHESFTFFGVNGERSTPPPEFRASEYINIETGLELDAEGNFSAFYKVPFSTVSVLPDSIVTSDLDTSIVIADVPDYTYPSNDFYP